MHQLSLPLDKPDPHPPNADYSRGWEDGWDGLHVDMSLTGDARVDYLRGYRDGTEDCKKFYAECE